MTKKIYYIRSTSIINDSRASKEIYSLINNGYDVTALGWDRDGIIGNDNYININNVKVKSYFYKYNAKYGKSIKTIIGLFKFQFWLKHIIKINIKNIDYIHAC